MFTIVLLFCLTYGIQGQPNPVIDIAEFTSVRGVTEYVPNTAKPIYAFRGIPYAAPPVGDLRFRAPQTAELWIGELDGTAHGPICPQTRIDIMSEDCLLLNIWTPTLEVNQNLSTLVWIHGGSFQWGSGNSRSGTELASFEDVIVVTINYRLAVMGFFTTGDANAPGNVGLMDAQMAIQWLRTHIGRFGGDPDSITIFGESAGGMAVSALVLSPSSQGLFKRAISQSGTLTAPNRANPWTTAASQSRTIAEILGCAWTSTEAVVECMRGLDWEDIEYHGTGIQPYPAIDGTWLPDWPFNMYNMGEFNRIDYLLGYNRDEGYFFIFGADPNRENIRELFRAYIARYYNENVDAITEAVLQEYVDFNQTDPDYYVFAYSNLIGECSYNGPSNDVARKTAALYPNVYMYHFNHRPGWSSNSDWVTATHGDEIPFVFGAPFSASGGSYTEQGRALSRQMMSYWANFAKTGNPNGAGLPTWPRVTCQNIDYMELVYNPRAEQNYVPNRMRVWMETVPALDTYRAQFYRGFPWSCPSQ
ncbi:unnamed protein product [Owenia fusiformis]|uniref:Carboxylic ester hydrolase n=1 Tax=Owenia fusiformis TaxID=6347 RepID=A0A8J1TSP8_OWEFU|nr:unnamed protein product [Owenia fusiformis]